MARFAMKPAATGFAMVGKSPAIFWMVLSLALHLVGLAFWPSSRNHVTPQPGYLLVERWDRSGDITSPSTADDPASEKTPGLPAVTNPSQQKTRRALPENPPAMSTDSRPSVELSRGNAPSQVATVTEPLSQDPRPDTAQDGLYKSAPPGPEEPADTQSSTAASTENGKMAAIPQTARRLEDGAGASSPPVYASNPAPGYPALARRKGWEGNVLLLVDVSARGRVSRVSVLQSSGYELLDQAASQAVYRWRFQPASLDNRTIPGKVKVPIHFSLKN